MPKFFASMTSKGRVTIPAAVRRQLGLEMGDTVIFRVEGGHVSLYPSEHSLDAIFGSVPALPDRRETDFEDQIEAAMAEVAERRVAKLQRS